MKVLDERNKECPIPLIDAKKELDRMRIGNSLLVIVDNEIAAQNLVKMANHKGCSFSCDKTAENEFHVKMRKG